MNRATVPATQEPKVVMRGDRAVTTSRDIARCFGKRHDNVLRDIEKLECSEEFRILNFEESSYINEQNKQQPEFEITRDGFSILAMGFTGRRAMEWKERYIALFNAMEQALQGPLALGTDSDVAQLRAERDAATGEIITQIKARVEQLETALLLSREQLRQVDRWRERALWATGPMGAEEFEEVRDLMLDGLNWARIAQDHSYRSPGALSSQFRRHGERLLAEKKALKASLTTP
uniref:Phage regulatory protein, rha family n=1 Tax=Candidatus Kentrum sp. LPFa TaxID=2126335 RepID=A0A450Y0Z6_9GAMM|nr:MAG: phage regulatory protein, rha family [Candidatus Kentron sp. LPFa]VFK35203.1 MAG: phage regulatory protein, rha family [Candidatus Kentron sp. LPFa]